MKTRLEKSAVSSFLRALAIFESSVIRPDREFDDFNSSIFLAESVTLIHTKFSVGKLELDQNSLLKFIFQIANEFEFGNYSNSMLSASFLTGTTVL